MSIKEWRNEQYDEVYDGDYFVKELFFYIDIAWGCDGVKHEK